MMLGVRNAVDVSMNCSKLELPMSFFLQTLSDRDRVNYISQSGEICITDPVTDS